MYKILENPLVAFTLAFVNTRLQPLREKNERGASALETAIIAAVLIAAAVAIGTIVLQKVKDAGKVVQDEKIPT